MLTRSFDISSQRLRIPKRKAPALTVGQHSLTLPGEHHEQLAQGVDCVVDIGVGFVSSLTA